MDKSWINQYFDTDQEVYREIIYTDIIDTTRVVDDKVIVDEHLKKLYQEINTASIPQEIIKIKKEYWINRYHDTDQEVYREIIFSEMIASKKREMMKSLISCQNFIKDYMMLIQKGK